MSSCFFEEAIRDEVAIKIDAEVAAIDCV